MTTWKAPLIEATRSVRPRPSSVPSLHLTGREYAPMDRLLPRRLSREIEVAWGLALGFVLNGVLFNFNRLSCFPIVPTPHTW